MQPLIAAFTEHLKARSARTAFLYTNVLTKFYGSLTPQEATAPDRAAIDAFLDRPRLDGRPRRGATVNLEIAALREFSEFAVDRGASPLPIKNLPFRKEPRRDPVFLTEDELCRLFVATASEPEPWRRSRNLALVAGLTEAGLRVSELAGLNLDQLDFPGLTFTAVRGKGATIRTVAMNAETALLVRAWLEVRATLGLGDEPALFVSSRGSRITVREVERLFVTLRPVMNTAKKVTPHSGRHTLGTLLLIRRAAFDTVAAVLGHSSLETTRWYGHLIDVRTREAIDGVGALIPRDVLPQVFAPAAEPAASLTDNVPANDNDGLDGQHGLSDVGRRDPQGHSGCAA